MFARIALLVFCCVSFAKADSPATLRWRWKSGETMKLRVTQSTVTSSAAGDKRFQLTLLTAMEMQWQVERIDENNTAEIIQAFTRLQMRTVDVEGNASEFDSASAQPPPAQMQELAAAVRPLLGSRFTVRISERGEIQSVTLGEQAEARLASVPKSSPLRRLLTTEGLQRTLQQALPLLPQEPQSQGDIWKQTRKIASPVGQIQIDQAFTLQGVQEVGGKPLTRIDMSAQLQWESNKPLKQTYKGVFYYDHLKGWLKHSQISQTLESESRFRDSVIPVKTQSTVTLKLEPWEK